MTTKTCAQCRSRKIWKKCDGLSPICGPCTKSKRPLICGYPAITSSAAKVDIVKETLPKGAACLPCRRKKKKCDAEHPCCNTCKVVGREYECTYEGDDGYSRLQALLKRNQELEQALRKYEENNQLLAISVPDFDLDFPDSPDLVANIEDSPLITALEFSPGFRNPPRGPNTVRLDRVFWDLLGSPPPSGSTVSPTLLIPQATMLLKSPKSDIDMTFRAIFIAHRHQYGLWLPMQKLQALFMGDLSGSVLHPCLVHLSHLWGCLLLQEYEGAFTLSLLEDSHLSTLLDSIDPSNCEAVVLIQVYVLLSIYFFYKHRWIQGAEYAGKAINIVNDFGMRISPPKSSKSDLVFIQTGASLGGWESCTIVQEQTNALSQLLYAEIDAYLLTHRPVSLLCSDLESQLRDDLPIVYPTLCKTSIPVLHAQSILFAKDSYNLIAALHNQFTPEWLESYWELLAQLKQHISILDSFLLKLSYSADREIGLTVKYCSILCHSTEAELQRQLAIRGHAESLQQCRESLSRVVNATKRLQDLDFYFLDPLLAVCWSGAVEALIQLNSKPRGPGGASPPPDPQLQTQIAILNEAIRKLKNTIPYLSGRTRDFGTDVRELLQVSGALPTPHITLC